jgi:hypothetical protein
VAVSNLVELRRFVTEQGVGVVMDERTPQTIAAAISELLNRKSELAPSPAKIAELRRRYGWTVQEQRLQGLYASFDARLGRPRPTPDSELAPVSR